MEEEGLVYNKLTEVADFNPFPTKPWFFFTCLHYKSFENTVEKRRNRLVREISPFPSEFSIHLDNFLPF